LINLFNCHSIVVQRISYFIFLKNQKRDPSALRPQDDKELPNGVILSEAKNLLFSPKKASKKDVLQAKALKMKVIR
jgi:hypothetical protein